MHYVILDDTANLVDSYDDRQEARRALVLLRWVGGADKYALITYGDDGLPIGEAE